MRVLLDRLLLVPADDRAYPSGGGSYTVAKENLGPRAALLAGAALALDYVLNVAVGISAGVGALVSAIPSLLPHTLALCLAILALLTSSTCAATREVGARLHAADVPLRRRRSCVVIAVGSRQDARSRAAIPTPVAAPPALPVAP